MKQVVLSTVPALTIDPNAIYEEGAIALALGITLSALLAARHAGELQFVRRGRRVFITGKNLLAWLEPSSAYPTTASPQAVAVA